MKKQYQKPVYFCKGCRGKTRYPNRSGYCFDCRKQNPKPVISNQVKEDIYIDYEHAIPAFCRPFID